MEKPDRLHDDHLEFLDELRDSGDTNMYAAGSWLSDEFPDLSRNDTKAILRYWMKSFSERHENRS